MRSRDAYSKNYLSAEINSRPHANNSMIIGKFLHKYILKIFRNFPANVKHMVVALMWSVSLK